MKDVLDHYELQQRWVYWPSKDRTAMVNVWVLMNPDPSGQLLPYMITVDHDGIEVKRIAFDKFHITMFTFKKTIDKEVLYHV